MRHMLRTFAAVATVAVIAAACGDAPDEDGADAGDATETTSEETTEPADDETTAAEEPTADETAAGGDLTGCLVTDTAGLDDRSFNQTAFAGLEQAEDEIGVEAVGVESQTEADYGPNLETFLSQDCTLIVSVGFALDSATQTVAQANPEQLFAIVDVDFAEFDADGNYVGDVTYPNVRELTFQTDEAAFLAGYLAAGMSETGVVGTYGGLPFPTVTIFMDGFLAGVRHHNAVNGTDVEVRGWDGTDGLFTNDFEDQEAGRNTTDQLLAQDADVIMPVAGSTGLGTVTAVEDANADGANAKVIWVDTDGTVTVPDSADVFLTSVEKKMDVAVFETMESVVNDTFEGGLYVGTLENDGVGISPYGAFDDDVPQQLKDEIDQLRQDIIGGMSVSPEDY